MSQTKNIKKSIANLEDKKNTIFFFVPDVHGVPAGSIYEIYFHASVLKKAGYKVIVFTETSKYEKPDFIEPELMDVEHI